MVEILLTIGVASVISSGVDFQIKSVSSAKAYDGQILL